MRKQTKRLSILLVLILILGGLAFAYSNTDLFKGQTIGGGGSGGTLDLPGGGSGGFDIEMGTTEGATGNGGAGTTGGVTTDNDDDDDLFGNEMDTPGGYIPG